MLVQLAKKNKKGDKMIKVFDFERTPVVDIVNDIMIDAVKRGASDIHFDPHENFMQVRIRVDGELINYAEVPEEFIRNLVTRIKIISGMNITESRLPQDGAIKATIKDVELDIRVSSIPTSNGEKIVLRILDYSLSLAGIETLGFSENNYKKVIEMISSPNGIILVTGATGSGKSTTVYSILQRLNKESANLISIEDPIEMDIEGINQIQANPEIGLTFAKALRSILRQDPNVIMIGEIRDSETAKIAISAAVTGHLVLSTLHTNDALSTIERLLDMDVEKYLLASALTGIIAQKLARKLCNKCKHKRPTTKYEKKLLKDILHKDIDEVYEANGCDECNNGYKGRIAIQEVLMISQTIQDALSGNIKKEELRKLVYDDNVNTLIQDGMEKVVEGLTTIEEVLKLIELDNIEEEKDEEIHNVTNSKLDSKEYQNNTSVNSKVDKKIVQEKTINDLVKQKGNQQKYKNDQNETKNNLFDQLYTSF